MMFLNEQIFQDSMDDDDGVDESSENGDQENERVDESMENGKFNTYSILYFSNRFFRIDTFFLRSYRYFSSEEILSIISKALCFWHRGLFNDYFRDHSMIYQESYSHQTFQLTIVSIRSI